MSDLVNDKAAEAAPQPRPDGTDSPTPAPRKRRRGSRGGRSRTRSAPGVTTAGAGVAGAAGAASPGSTAPPEASGAARQPELPDPPQEGRPSPEAAARATVPRKPQIGDSRPAPVPRPAPPAATAAGGGSAAGATTAGGSRKRRRRGRGRGKGGGGGLRPVEGGGPLGAPDDPLDLDPETLERRRGRERKGRPVGRYQMIVHVRDHAVQLAVLEGLALVEHYVSLQAADDTRIDGNIYLGRVQNVLPGMEAAFVDIGTPKNAVLYRGDVQYDRDDVEGGSGSPRIEQLLRNGQNVLCQVTKNPIGAKGARLTQEVSLPGRFVVLVPDSDTYGISKRLPDDERKRLRKALDEIRPAGHGLIVRTAAEGATPEELRRDITRLVGQWEQIDALAKRSRAPALLYREPGMAVRVIREEFNKEYRGVVIDDPALHEEVREYVASIAPELADRVELYPADDPLPVFERYHVHEQLHKALDRKVWLRSGGSVVIDRAEALTVIDVNTGKNVGTSNLEETVFRNNLEAAEEVARQLRLRDIGGIIVVDFIDMEIRKNRDEVVRFFKECLARDKTKTQVFDISELGLVEMTRKRVSEGLVESFSGLCPTCAGRGIVLDETLL